MAKLIIFDDRVRGVELPNRAVVVGRSLKADITIRDSILSRKHCTLVPEVGCVRLIDLKSANGSYVNGARVDRTELCNDDVIEIGSTVIVLLENGTWQRGVGLASLRNPLKAQELVQRIRVRSESSEGEGRESPLSPKRNSRSVRERVSQAEREFIHWAKTDFCESPLALEMFERYVCHRVVRRLVRRIPELRETLLDAVDRVLDAKNFRGDSEVLREAIHVALRESFEAVGIARSAVERSAEKEKRGRDRTPGRPAGLLGERVRGER